MNTTFYHIVHHNITCSKMFSGIVYDTSNNPAIVVLAKFKACVLYNYSFVPDSTFFQNETLLIHINYTQQPYVILSQSPPSPPPPLPPPPLNPPPSPPPQPPPSPPPPPPSSPPPSPPTHGHNPHEGPPTHAHNPHVHNPHAHNPHVHSPHTHTPLLRCPREVRCQGDPSQRCTLHDFPCSGNEWGCDKCNDECCGGCRSNDCTGCGAFQTPTCVDPNINAYPCICKNAAGQDFIAY